MIKIIDEFSLQNDLRQRSLIEAYKIASQGLGKISPDLSSICELLQIPYSLGFALQSIFEEESDPKTSSLDSISFFSLCKGLFLPLTGMSPSKTQYLFHVRYKEKEFSNQEIVEKFLRNDTGLDLVDKIAYLMGDPFSGIKPRIGKDTLLRILSRIRFVSQKHLRERLPKVGDIGVIFVEEVKKIRSDPPISAKEVIVILRNLPEAKTNIKKRVLSDLFLRAGCLERYFLCRLILRRLNFGYEYRRDLITSVMASEYNIPERTVENAIALTDIFEVADLIQYEGPKSLTKLVLKPLNPVSPALAGTGEVDKKTQFPIWVECKYDGIRLMVHKETGRDGRVKFAAFTRRKYDWLELVSGLEHSLNALPGYSFIIDGELHGRISDWEGGFRQATVYEIYKYIQGSSEELIQLQYVCFDILYINGKDITNVPFYQRRKTLEQLMLTIPLQGLPLPLVISEGWEAHNMRDFQKWYKYFLNQGHEGAIAKIPNALYALGKRTQHWLKKKEAIYLDLVINGALWATGDRGPQTFSTYILACREEQKWRDIGRTQGLGQMDNFEIVHRIANEGLITGKTIEVRTSTGTHQGVALIPSIVVTVRFEDVVKDSEDVFSLRDPKIVHIRPRGDASPEDVDSYQSIRRLYLEKTIAIAKLIFRQINQ